LHVKLLTRWILALVFVLLLGFVYKSFDPSTSLLFPPCPFRVVTGLDCPGCGSQRAAHDLLNGDVVAAFEHNQLLVTALPYLLIGFLFEFIPVPNQKMLIWRKRLFGVKAIYLITLLVLAFWIIRNL